MRYEAILAAIAALGLAACSPDLSTESQPPKQAAGAPAQPVEAEKPAAPAQPAEADKPAVAQAEASAQETQADRKEEDKKDDGEKKPQ
jgi:hypothetical protein